MHLNEILAANLRALMAGRDDLNTQQRIRDKAARLGYTVSQSTVQRILTRQVHTSLDIVEQLAETYGLQPLELLRPIDAQDDQISPSYDETRLLYAWRKLSEPDKHKVMAYISVSTLNQAAPDTPPAASEVALSPEARRLAQWLDGLPDGPAKHKAYANAMGAINRQLHAAAQSAAPDLPAPPETAADTPHDQPASDKTPTPAGTGPRARSPLQAVPRTARPIQT